jgi:hypothetical protein
VLQRCESWSRASRSPGLRKYLQADKDDFGEQFPRLPLEANPLDPQFADPALLQRTRRPDRRVENNARGRGAPQQRQVLVRNAEMDAGAFENDLLDPHDFAAAFGEEGVDPRNQAGMNGDARDHSITGRLLALPAPVQEFLLRIVKQRCKDLPHLVDEDAEQEEDDDDLDASVFIDEECVLAEIIRIRDMARRNGRQGESWALPGIEQLVFELLHNDPARILEDIQRRALGHNQDGGADGGTMDLNQPLMQLFLRSFLPWNRLDSAQMRRR